MRGIGLGIDPFQTFFYVNDTLYTYYGNQTNPDAVDSLLPEGRGYSALLPWATFAYAQDETPEGHTIRPAAGIYSGLNFHYPDNAYGAGVSADIPRSVTFQATNAVRVAFFGNSTVGDQVWQGLVIDGSVTPSQRGVDISSGSPVQSVSLDDCEITGVSQYAVYSPAHPSVSIYLNDIDIADDFSYSAILHNQAGRDADAEFKLTNSRLICTSLTPINDYLLWNGATLTPTTFKYDVTYDSNDISCSIGATTALFDVIRAKQATSYKFNNNTVNVSSTTIDKTVELLKPAGAAAYRIEDVEMFNNLVTFNCGTGFALFIGGDPDALGYTDKATLRDNVVVGEYFATRTPHGQTCGRAELGDEYLIKDCISTDIYVGFLMSMGYSQSTNIIEDCLAVDCYGSSYYAKGNTDALIKNNRAVVTTKYNQRNQAVLSATAQDSGTIQNVATTFDGNTVTVQGDAIGTDWFALAGNTVSSGVVSNATWINNVYNVPDTLDIDDLMFVIDGLYVSGTDWLQAFPTDTINFKTAAEIQAIVDEAYDEVEAKKASIGTGSPYWIDRGSWSDALRWLD